MNVGRELSGPHFAIVLNKKDNAKSGTLLVVPLTSTERNGSIDIGSKLFEEVESSTNKLAEECEVYKYEVEHIRKDFQSHIDTLRIKSNEEAKAYFYRIKEGTKQWVFLLYPFNRYHFDTILLVKYVFSSCNKLFRWDN